MKLVLASGSPRRKKLLSWMGLGFEVMEHGFDERTIKAKSTADLVGELALSKADTAAVRVGGGRLVIGSDLMVDLKGRQMGQPKDKVQAKKMLKLLSNKTHTIYCGVAVVNSKTKEGVMSVAETKVKMKNYPEAIIDRYIKKFRVVDKGGGYAILYKLNGYGGLVEKFEGGISTIIGLPLHYLEKLLLEFGVRPKKDWRKICKQETGYEY